MYARNTPHTSAVLQRACLSKHSKVAQGKGLLVTQTLVVESVLGRDIAFPVVEKQHGNF